MNPSHHQHHSHSHEEHPQTALLWSHLYNAPPYITATAGMPLQQLAQQQQQQQQFELQLQFQQQQACLPQQANGLPQTHDGVVAMAGGFFTPYDDNAFHANDNTNNNDANANAHHDGFAQQSNDHKEDLMNDEVADHPQGEAVGRGERTRHRSKRRRRRQLPKQQQQQRAAMYNNDKDVDNNNNDNDNKNDNNINSNNNGQESDSDDTAEYDVHEMQDEENDHHEQLDHIDVADGGRAPPSTRENDSSSIHPGSNHNHNNNKNHRHENVVHPPPESTNIDVATRDADKVVWLPDSLLQELHSHFPTVNDLDIDGNVNSAALHAAAESFFYPNRVFFNLYQLKQAALVFAGAWGFHVGSEGFFVRCCFAKVHRKAFIKPDKDRKYKRAAPSLKLTGCPFQLSCCPVGNEQYRRGISRTRIPMKLTKSCQYDHTCQPSPERQQQARRPCGFYTRYEKLGLLHLVPYLSIQGPRMHHPTINFVSAAACNAKYLGPKYTGHDGCDSMNAVIPTVTATAANATTNAEANPKGDDVGGLDAPDENKLQANGTQTTTTLSVAGLSQQQQSQPQQRSKQRTPRVWMPRMTRERLVQVGQDLVETIVDTDLAPIALTKMMTMICTLQQHQAYQAQVLHQNTSLTTTTAATTITTTSTAGTWDTLKVNQTNSNHNNDLLFQYAWGVPPPAIPRLTQQSPSTSPAATTSAATKIHSPIENSNNNRNI